MERKKVISGRDAGRLTKIAGLIGENFRGAEPYTVDKFKAALESGEFAFPGGYPTYFITDDGDSLSYDSAKENAEQIIDAIETGDNSGWRVVGQEVNWEDPELYCADSGKRIPSAYAEPEDEDRPEDFESHLTTHIVKESKMKNKKSIKLSSLSEGLRKEVKSLMKEGKTKLSQMPAGVRRRLVKESNEFFGTNSQEFDPNDAYRFGANAKKSTDRRWNTQAFHEDVFDGKYTLSKMYGEDTVDVIDNNDHTEEGGIYTFGSKEEAMDFIEKREGGNIEMVKESKMKNKKSIKLSSLSEGLRKQVRSLMKDGKTKMSMLPVSLKKGCLRN